MLQKLTVDVDAGVLLVGDVFRRLPLGGGGVAAILAHNLRLAAVLVGAYLELRF